MASYAGLIRRETTSCTKLFGLFYVSTNGGSRLK
jgi:hypothetical protein